MARVTLSRWGNSTGIRIPNQFLKRMNLVEGIEMEIVLRPYNHILLRPLEAPEESGEELRSHLKTLLSQIRADSPCHEEINLGIKGDEII